MFDILWIPRFWVLAGLYAVLVYLYRHQCAHAQSAMTGRSTLHPVFIGIMGFYNALFITWIFLIWYGYRTYWTHVITMWVVGTLGALMLRKAEKLLGLGAHAWMISLIGIGLVPLLLGVMLWLV